MSFILPADYAHRLGITDPAEIPDWLPGVTAEYLTVVDAFDATRVDGRYGEESLAFAMAMEPWAGRGMLISWALVRALLGQPGGSALFRRETVEGVRWGSADALWLASMAPKRGATAHLVLAALECVHADEMPLAAKDVAALRDVVTDPVMIERLDEFDARIAAAPRPEDVLDPRFVERIAGTLDRPIREMLFRCEVKSPQRPSWWWRDTMKRRIEGHESALREILAAIPAHLEEHGSFSQGEDTLRGIVFVAEAFEKGWLIPLLADVILAAGGTAPARSQKLANASVEALYYHHKAVGVLRDLEKKVPGKALKKRIAETIEYM